MIIEELNKVSKIKSGIIGHAIGDAIGVPIEFSPRYRLEENPVKEMIGYGFHNVEEGTFSDDTSMEIAMISSYIEKGKIDYDDIMNKWILWIEKGEYTATGKFFDIGRTTMEAIDNYKAGEKALTSGIDNYYANGNGSLMRILPVAYIAYYKNYKKDKIYQIVKEVSSLTHRHEISIMGCYIYVLFIINLLEEKNIIESYQLIQKEDYSMFSKDTIDCYQRILKEDISTYKISDIRSSGYVVDSLEASLFCILNTTNYKDAIIKAINLGEDTDTIGAITGSIAGIYYGYDAIPKEWLLTLKRREYLEELAIEFEKKVKENENDKKNNLFQK